MGVNNHVMGEEYRVTGEENAVPSVKINLAMNQYRFVVGNSPCQLSFWVTAETPQIAVTRANKSFQEVEGSSEAFIGMETFGVRVVIDQNARVSLNDIVEERPVPALPEKALQLLWEHEYDNSGGDIQGWRQLLIEDVESTWTRGFAYGSGMVGGVYGLMTVTVRRSSSYNKWCFYLKAHLYMLNRADGLTGEEGGIKYAVDFQDRQLFIGEEEFPDALPAYEKKFSELIYLLRAGDPVDGLPLTPAERLTGEIEGFMPRFKPRQF